MAFPLVLALLVLGMSTFSRGAEPAKDSTAMFQVTDNDASRYPEGGIDPWRTIPLDPGYGGRWVVAGDLDNDGKPEIVSAQNCNVNDVHWTTAVAAQRLDGAVLWTWGDPKAGNAQLSHDVAVQVHDWDGDGRLEVILAAKDALVELDGATGRERRRIPIPDQASDCIVFCDLSGKGRPTDVLVKDRYWRIWAMDHEGNTLWHVKEPGGFRTAHQPVVLDIDGDGRDEVFAGYTLLDSDGSEMWTYRSKTVDQAHGHLDCIRTLRRGDTLKDWRFALTCCGANNIAVIDGEGNPVWEKAGSHFESIDIGRVMPGTDSLQIVVDIDHQPEGLGPLWILDENGEQLGEIMTRYARCHRLIDWNGDGLDEIVAADARAVYNHKGERIATFAMPEEFLTEARGRERTLQLAEMTGDGKPDILMIQADAVLIYRNEHGSAPQQPWKPGTGPNVTLY